MCGSSGRIGFENVYLNRYVFVNNVMNMQRSGINVSTLAGVRERSISEASSSDESMGGNAKLSGMFLNRPKCVDSEGWIERSGVA